MTKHPRIRRIAKWAGLVLCVLIVVAWVVSLRWEFWYEGGSWLMWCGHGGLLVSINRIHLDDPSGWNVLDVNWIHWEYYLPRFKRDLSGTLKATTCNIPLWLPLVVVAIPTAILFYRDRRIPPGHCQKCGYDLTGNESGRCPECGRTI